MGEELGEWENKKGLGEGEEKRRRKEKKGEGEEEGRREGEEGEKAPLSSPLRRVAQPTRAGIGRW